MGLAFGGCDEARAHLNAVVPEVHHSAEGGRIADAAGANDGEAKALEVVEKRLGRKPAGVSTGDAVDRDQTVYAALDCLLRPPAFGDVMVDDSADLGDPVDHPPRVSERGDEEANPLLERDVDPSLDPF